MKRKIFLLLNAVLLLALASCKKEQYITEPGNLVPFTVDQAPGHSSITVRGAMLHTEAFGHPDSTMILVLHGGPGGDYRSLLNLKDLAEQGYLVIFYDQRGSGLSQRFSKGYYNNMGLGVLDLLYQEISGVVAHYRSSPQQKLYLVGHSWGAILATGYAAHFPEQVQGLAVIEPGGLVWNDIRDYVKESRSFSLWSEALNDAAYLDQFLTGKENQHEILDYKMGLVASKNEITGEDNTLPGSTWRSGAVFNAALFETGKKHKPDFSAGIQQFQVPVFFVYSGKNKAYPDSWALRICGAYPIVQRLKLDQAGHSSMISDTGIWQQQMMPALVSYLRSL